MLGRNIRIFFGNDKLCSVSLRNDIGDRGIKLLMLDRLFHIRKQLRGV